MGRGKPADKSVGSQFGRHAALDAHAPADLNDLPRAQLGEPEAAQGLHMDKHVRGAFTAGEEAEAPYAVEPLHHGPLPLALRLDDNVRALRQLRRVDGRALIHAEDAKGLHALWTLQDLRMHPGAVVAGVCADDVVGWKGVPQSYECTQFLEVPPIVRFLDAVPEASFL